MDQGSDAGPPQTPQAPPPVTEPQGERTHPVSALVRVWIWVAAGLVGFGRNALEEGDRSLLSIVWFVLAIAGIAAVLGAAFGYLSWWFTRYFIDGREMRVESGVLTRRSRRAPYERIQSVDVAEPIAARIFGLCELRIELAGGDDSRVPLQYLRRTDAEQLRALLLRRAYEAGSSAVRDELTAGVGVPPNDTPPYEVPAAAPYGADRPSYAPDASPSGTPAGPATPLPAQTPAPVPSFDQAPPILVVPPQRLVLATLLSTEFLLPLGILAVMFVAGLLFPGIYFGLIPFVFWLFQVVMNRVVAQWGFALRRSPRGLHISRGLLSRVSQTIPYERVQAVVVREALLWRMFGWQRTEVTVAGASTDSDSGDAVLLPIGRPEDVRRVVGELFTDVDLDHLARVRAPKRSAWFAPIGWRRRAAGSGTHAFAADRGWISHRTDVVPHAKTQSVAISQGPLQRILRIADLSVHTPDGPVSAFGHGLDAADVRALAESQLAQARAARLRLGDD